MDDAFFDKLRDEVSRRFGVPRGDVRLAFAPYRICPLGAHIDHQLGRVTAMALDRGIALAYAPRPEPAATLQSLDFPGTVRVDFNRIEDRQPGDWGNYLRGAVRALQKRGTGSEFPRVEFAEDRLAQLTTGLVGLTAGGIAAGGLSSSAAVGVAYLLALEDVNGLAVSAEENIRLDQEIENGYLGLRNGILDQSAILLGRRGALTLIDCRTLAHEWIVSNVPPSRGSPLPPNELAIVSDVIGGRGAEGSLHFQRPSPPPPLPRPLPDAVTCRRDYREAVAGEGSLESYSILIAFSGLQQALISTDYNRRVAECADAAATLLQAAGRPDAAPLLGNVTAAGYAAYGSILAGPAARRAAHFFGEMARVEQGVAAWREGDLVGFGRLVTASGLSSIENYECGAPPLVDLYRILIATAGVYGARFRRRRLPRLLHGLSRTPRGPFHRSIRPPRLRPATPRSCHDGTGAALPFWRWCESGGGIASRSQTTNIARTKPAGKLMSLCDFCRRELLLPIGSVMRLAVGSGSSLLNNDWGREQTGVCSHHASSGSSARASSIFSCG